MIILTGPNGNIGSYLFHSIKLANIICTGVTKSDWSTLSINHDVNYIIHCGDVSPKSHPDSAQLLNINNGITDSVMQLWDKFPNATFIGFNSLLMYDCSLNGDISSTSRRDINPNNTSYYYGQSKQYLQSEILVRREHGRDGKLLLLGNIFGTLATKSSNIVSDLVNQLRNTGKIHLKSYGLERRSFLYIEDLYKILMIVKDIRDIGITGLPSTNNYNIRQVVEMIDSLVTHDISMTYEEVTYPNRTVSMEEPITQIWPQYFLGMTPMLVGLSSMLKENGIS